MLSEQHRQAIYLNALEQAIRQAQLAKTTPDLLVPTTTNWPFALTQDDIAFLRSCPLPISPA